MAAPDAVVNLDDKFSRFADHWSPKTIGQINDLHLKAVKAHGEFVWHSHGDTDEFFLVRSGRLQIEMRDRDPVSIGPGEFFIVPRGVEHRPVATMESEVLLLEPAGIINTGDVIDTGLTATEEWI